MYIYIYIYYILILLYLGNSMSHTYIYIYILVYMNAHMITFYYGLASFFAISVASVTGLHDH